MRRAVSDRTGATVGTIGDDCVLGEVLFLVTDDWTGKQDDRSPEPRSGIVSISLPLTDARKVAGRRVAIFLVEE